MAPFEGPLERLDAFRWRIPRTFKSGMNVDGLIYADDALMEVIRQDKSPEQVANVACLPGVVRYSLAMPDIHWGYGFCIGGVAATDPEAGGVISPGGVGYDINCGVRLLRSDVQLEEARPKMEKLIEQLFGDIPTGVGRGGTVTFNDRELEELMTAGSRYVVDRGFGWDEDVELTEANGALEDPRPGYISQRALNRGRDQCGTLGSGNHFLEVQVVEKIEDPAAAAALRLEEGQLTVLIHSGSRGLGHQVCEDALKTFRHTPQKYGISLPDRQLACAPLESDEARQYMGGMRAAANFAWSNRQIMTHLTRQSFASVFERPPESLGMSLVYDVAHNIAKMEPYPVNGETKELCIHRKGATRAFPAGHPEIPERYRSVGQPVFVPGDMGRASYVLVGMPGSMDQTFGSSCHGAGRMMSRRAAVRASKGRNIRQEQLGRGVVSRARGKRGLEEELPEAYKDVFEVVDVLEKAGVSKKVARLRPIGVIKG